MQILANFSMHSYAMNDIFLKMVIFFKVFCDFLNTSDYKIDKYNLIKMLLLKHIWYEMVHKQVSVGIC